MNLLWFSDRHFSSKLPPGHHKRSGTSAALVLHTYLVCAHIGITQLGPSDEATCDLRMSVARSPSDLNNTKRQRCEDNRWTFTKHFPTEINRNFTYGQKKISKKNSVGKLTCLWYCVISTLDPPISSHWTKWHKPALKYLSQGLCIELNFDSSDKDNVN